MISRRNELISTRKLKPFGELFVPASSPVTLPELPHDLIVKSIKRNFMVVCRGFTINNQNELLSFCRRFGEVLGDEVHPFTEIVDRHDSGASFLFSNGSVPLHWDGAFGSVTPKYVVLACMTAPRKDQGGETLFCDTSRIVRRASEMTTAAWSKLTLNYKYDEHTDPRSYSLITKNSAGKPMLRFVQPPDADVQGVAGLKVTINDGMARRIASEDLLSRLRFFTQSKSYTYSHSWIAGDVILADNLSLLHGRRAFSKNAPRKLLRIHIAGDEE